jgi:uncharacterized protein YcfJ
MNTDQMKGKFKQLTAVGGALVGSAVGAPGAGAAIGGAGGAVAGYAIGNHEQNEERGDYYRR